jgi:hypothetical protein
MGVEPKGVGGGESSVKGTISYLQRLNYVRGGQDGYSYSLLLRSCRRSRRGAPRQEVLEVTLLQVASYPITSYLQGE